MNIKYMLNFQQITVTARPVTAFIIFYKSAVTVTA
jgi:hypothetical protein